MRILLILITLLWKSIAMAQNANIADSLEHLLAHNPGDSLEFEIKRKLGFYHPEPTKALQYSREALEIAVAQENLLNQARALAMVGQCHRLLGNKVESFESAYEALALFDQLKIPKRQASLLSQIASNHSADGEYAEAISLFKRAEELFLNQEDDYRVATTLVNLGETYRLAGEFGNAEQTYDRALELNKTVEHPVIEAYSLGNLGLTHSALDKTDQALEELEESVRILTELGDPASVVIYDAEIGNILIKGGEQTNGLRVIEDAYKLAVKEQLKDQIRDLSLMLSQLYSEFGAFEKAYPYQVTYQAYQDSLVNAENVRQIEQTKARYELDKQASIANAEIAQKETEIFYSIVAIGLLVVVAALIFYAYQSKRKSNRSLKEKNEIINQQIIEKELLHKEMHHRVKNNLQLISSIMGLHASQVEDKDISNALTEGKSRMEAMTLIHQKLYGKDQATYINLKSYLDNLSRNLKASYGIQELSLNCEDVDIEADDSIPIGLIVNEAVCNSVKYADEEKLQIQIDFSRMDEVYELTVSDNGKGFTNTPKKGFGSNLIETLAKQLRAEVSVTGSEDGTTLKLVMPELKALEGSNELVV